MKKEDLIKLKQKISELSEEEQKLRNLYLRKISSGEMYGPMVGYASIDRPWLKYYDDKSIDALINYKEVNLSMYETLYRYAKDHPDEIAIEYLGREITYYELLNNIDMVANSLKAINVCENEIVPIILPNCPEARYLIYACSKIGAIPNPIMPTISEVDFENILKKAKCNQVFMMDSILEKYQALLEENKISKNSIITISPLRSSSGLYKCLYMLNNGKDNYADFLAKGKYTSAKVVKRSASDIALIEQTGGTTGLTSKGVIITNKNVYASNYQLENGGFDFEPGDTILDILLPSISYGAAFEHLTLCNGIKNYMIPILVKKQINKYISKYKPNHIMMGPLHFEFIVKSKKNRQWQFIKNIVSGGDSMSIELEKSANKRLKENNVSVCLEQGYGESECFGACACNHSQFVKNGSVGIPHLLTTIAIFSYNENNEDFTEEYELSYGQKGEICINSPVVMQGYLDNSEDTNLVLKKHSDGTTWLHTGDIGYIDESGYIHITERIKELIFRNGFKVSPKKINNKLLEKYSSIIDTSVVLGVPDKIERNVPIIFIKFKDPTFECFLNDIEEYVNDNFKGLESVREIVVLNDIARTSSGKIDKKQIKKDYLERSSQKNNKNLILEKIKRIIRY